MKGAKVRLYVDQPLGPGQSVSLSRDQAHYLFSVMRHDVGSAVLSFNGKDGEWQCEVVEASKRKGRLVCSRQNALQRDPPDLWLLFAPIKKARTDFIVEKAAELGVARILPVQTDYTNSERIRRDRLQAHAVEAAEQCGGTFVPPVEEIQKLAHLVAKWPKDRKLLFCDEALADDPQSSSWSERFGESNAREPGVASQKVAILIGPEGGFSESERVLLKPMADAVSLGPRILRADTAVVSAVTLWQATHGDWN